MGPDDAYYALTLATSGLGHMPCQGSGSLQTTLSLADLVLTQASHPPTQSYVIPHNVASGTDYGSVGRPMADSWPQGAPRCHPLASMPLYTGHASGPLSIINDVPVGCLPESPMPLGRMSRGSSIRCEWVSEDGSICGHTVTRLSVPEHLAEHGIRRMHKDRVVQCRWRECGSHMKRESITRHAREVHLCFKRRSHRFLDYPCY